MGLSAYVCVCAIASVLRPSVWADFNKSYNGLNGQTLFFFKLYCYTIYC